MDANKKTARTAGAIYLVVVLTGIFSLAYVPSRLIVWDDAARTFQNISGAESLFRLSIISSMLCYIAFLLLPLALYKLLSPVNGIHAKLMVLFAVVSVPMSFINLQNKFDALAIINGAGYLNVFTVQQLQAKLMLLLDRYDNGILILQIFWGLWLLPFGYLVYKSGFLPKILGILLMMGCAGYLLSFIGHTIVPGYGKMPVARFITLPASLGEIGSCLWLLIVGVRGKRTVAQ